MKKNLIALLALLSTPCLFAAEGNIYSDQELLDLGLRPKLEFPTSSSLTPTLLGSTSQEERTLDVDPVDYVDTAKVFVVVDKAEKGSTETAQTLSLYLDGEKLYQFPVSTGKENEVKSSSGRTYIASTPIGFFRPTKIYKDYYSYTWGGAPMPHAVFFDGGTALHATTPNHFSAIGSRDSGGCVRLMPEAAKIVNETILTAGLPVWRIKEEPIEIKIKKWLFTVKKFTVVRTKIVDNTVEVPEVDRYTGELLDNTTNSVDAIIAITDRSKE